MESFSNKNPRVRFAPSPTGLQHIGGLRTSLYNYLFAKKHGGDFILRIEDTDRKRFVEGALENTIEFLNDFGLAYSEGPFIVKGVPETAARKSVNYPGIVEVGGVGPYIQSERLDLYTTLVDTLLEKGSAYRCFCTEERLERLREELTAEKKAPRYDRHCLLLSKEESDRREKNGELFVIRFRVPDNREEIYCSDLVRGEVRFHSKDVDDPVLLKSDGFPTYHLASIVDDHLMDITHVIRGEEWLPSLPKHILLYEAFGWEAPKFAHLPNILGSDGRKKLSKRDGDVSVESFVARGYLKEALINFVALLGWNPGEGKTQEIFTLDELIAQFDLAQVHKAGAVFDLKKLDWMNAEYIKKLSIEELFKLSRPFLDTKEFFKTTSDVHKSEAFLKRVLAIEQERLTTLVEVGENNQFFFVDQPAYDTVLLHWKENTPEMTLAELTRAAELLGNVSDTKWKRETLAEVLLAAAGDKKGDFLWPLRVALSGKQKSPSPMDIAWVLGKEETLERLRFAIGLLKGR